MAATLTIMEVLGIKNPFAGRSSNAHLLKVR